MACALSLIVALFAVLGRTGLLDTFVLCMFGGFFYAFNEAIFWRISVLDAGFAGRIFLYGSSLGLVSSLILGKKNLTKNSRNYYSSKSYQTLSLIGAVFIWVFIPAFSAINQLYKYENDDINLNVTQRVTYAHQGPMNIIFALCASTVAAFSVSMLINKKISVHDIVFSATSVFFYVTLGSRCFWSLLRYQSERFPCHASWNNCRNCLYFGKFFGQKKSELQWCDRLSRSPFHIPDSSPNWIDLLFNHSSHRHSDSRRKRQKRSSAF